MIDPKRLRDDYEAVKDGLASRHMSLELLEEVVILDQSWRKEKQVVDALINQQKSLSPKGKPTDEELKTLKEHSEKIKKQNEVCQEIEKTLREKLLYLPNVPDQSVPLGASEEANKEIKQVGDLPSFSFEPKSHDVLGTDLGILDFQSASKVTGARFVYYKGLGAKLERALINMMLETHTEKNGYEEVLPPCIVNSQSMQGTGQLPKFKDDSFQLADTDYWLSPTAEVQLTNMCRDQILDVSTLPYKVTAYTPCFRKEAGSYGKDMKGLIRHHQFNKVELVQFVKPEESSAALEGLLADAAGILDALKLPYRIVQLCTGDLGFSSAKTYDLEVWFPSQNQYREISSCSNFLDFQSRRAMIRYKEEGKSRYCHTLNGSGLAVGRTVAAIIENYQQKDGSIIIPDCLKSYIKVDKINGDR